MLCHQPLLLVRSVSKVQMFARPLGLLSALSELELVLFTSADEY